MEMISFGPTITGAHSPDERVKIDSVAKSHAFFVEVLKSVPAA
jgi:dipeptidase D